MRILVTGGCGFIGSCFVRTVLDDDPNVRITNFDKLTYAGNLENLRSVEKDARYRFVRGDVCDADAVAAAVADHDAVVHFAAESHVDRSIDASGTFITTNVLGSQVVFNAAMRAGIQRLLHISTDEVYGSIDEPASFTEADALEPNSPYSASKAAADLLARAYRETYKYPIMVTRTTNNFGPFHLPEKLIPLFITNLIDGRRLPLYGNGSNVRDWLYVEDNALAQWLVLREGRPGEVYNIGAGNELSNLELTRRLLDIFGEGEGRIERVTDRPGHDQRYSVDTTKIADLGWSPAHGFDEALESTVRWYRDHGAWWRPLKAAGSTVRRGLSSHVDRSAGRS